MSGDVAYGPRQTTPDRATAGGTYDVALGGPGGGERDRVVAQQLRDCFADLGTLLPSAIARYNRQFLGRAVRYCLGEGVHQFLDLGCGYPRWGNVHEIVQAGAPGSRVVYVDYESGPVEAYRPLLQDNDHAAVLHADLREPGTVLEHPDVRRLIDFSEPVALLLASVLQFVHVRPDDDLYAIVATFREQLAPGSLLVISHGAGDYLLEDSIAPLTELAEIYDRETEGFTLRTVAHVETFFGDTELVDGGVKLLPDWRPDDPAYTADHSDMARRSMCGGVGKV